MNVCRRVGKDGIEKTKELIHELSRKLDKLVREADSFPPDLEAKIRLAKIESGLDRPFMLSKYE